MSNKIKYETPQEDFWAGTFGNDYIIRNRSDEYFASNLNFFVKALHLTGRPQSLIEFGANVGMNLKAIKALYPQINLNGIEINEEAARELGKVIGINNVSQGSIFEYKATEKFEISLIKGVLIHINPDMLPLVYQKLYEASSKYILLCEYYNPSPVTLSYRGHTDRLFKRDFAGEMLEKYQDLKLIDYGFVYKRDIAFPQDDITWFLMEKTV